MLPMFTRIGAAAIKKDLTNTIAICNALNNPQQHYKTIHIAGTNGKGSTSHMLAAILQQAGYKTGLYTSPHLIDFRERIRVNGKPVSEVDVVLFVERNKTLIEQIKPSFFECTVAMAFWYFSIQEVDIAVVETGLGGRLDSTNVVKPELSIITNIGFDHMDLLGDTLDKIAFEKAGIIKKNTPVVVGEYLSITEPVFTEKASKENAKIVFVQDEVKINDFCLTNNGCSISVQTQQNKYDNVTCDLGGLYQKQNIATVIKSVEELNGLRFKITKQDLFNGLAQTKKLTGLLGRWQILSNHPLTITDVGHNVDGISFIVKQLELYNFNKLHMVFGMVKDKDITKVLALLPKHAIFYFTKANLPRALNEKDLKQLALQFNLQGIAFETVKDAIKEAKKNASENDLIFIGGSTFVVAEALPYYM